MENKRQIGAQYEEKAVNHFTHSGYLILERNFRNRCGEIDIIARKQGVLVFVEVKYRSTEEFGSPLEAVDARKQSQIRRVAQYYMLKNNLSEWTPCRFDVIGFSGDEMQHIENAF